MFFPILAVYNSTVQISLVLLLWKKVNCGCFLFMETLKMGLSSHLWLITLHIILIIFINKTISLIIIKVCIIQSSIKIIKICYNFYFSGKLVPEIMWKFLYGSNAIKLLYCRNVAIFLDPWKLSYNIHIEHDCLYFLWQLTEQDKNKLH